MQPRCITCMVYHIAYVMKKAGSMVSLRRHRSGQGSALRSGRAARSGQVRAARSGQVRAARSGQVRAARSGQVRAARSGQVRAARSGQVRAARSGQVRAARSGQVRAARSGQVRAGQRAPVRAHAGVHLAAIRPVWSGDRFACSDLLICAKKIQDPWRAGFRCDFCSLIANSCASHGPLA
jgi:hypothetical protein